MDVHIRDNQLAMGPHLIVRKTADETVTSSTVLQDDNHLILPVTGSEVYRVEFMVIYSAANGTGDIKCAFTFPAGGRIDMMGIQPDTGGTWNSSDIFSGTTSPTTARAFASRGTAIRIPMIIEGIYTNGGTGGSLTLQWAQNTSSGTATTVYTNSTLWAVKLA